MQQEPAQQEPARTKAAVHTAAVHTEEFVFAANGQRLAATKTVSADGPEPGILALHGLGPAATRHRVRYLLDALAAHGHGSMTFDFSGNRDSTGVLAESSLPGRRGRAPPPARRVRPAAPPPPIRTRIAAPL